MKELDWHNASLRAIKKFIVVTDADERRKLNWRIQDILHNTKPEQIAYKLKGSSYSFEVYDKVFDVFYQCTILSARGRRDWDDQIRGMYLSEVLLSPEMAADKDVIDRIMPRLHIDESKFSVYERAAMQMTLGKLNLEYTSPVPVLTSLSKDFNFPLSLFRRNMLDHFMDKMNPTREEFLFALMMEGVHGSTDDEKAAIHEAKVYIQGQSNQAD